MVNNKIICECGSSNNDIDTSSGQISCADCWLVLEENAIVSEIGFQENANGSSHVIGSFVSANDPRSLSMSAKQSGVRHGKESREQTLSNGRRLINKVTSHFQLRQSIIDAAYRLFSLAVNYNFIQGRKTTNVVAACIYICCRRETPPAPLFLLDFSDILQTNVFVLGNTLMKFLNITNLKLPVLDPSIYIGRFASKLEFGDQHHSVSLTATRLAKQMEKDWMVTGRRPSGICGACLLIASRMHGFRRTQQEIIDAVKICELTLKKRLDEFSLTPISSLSTEEFHNNAVLQNIRASNPPSFKNILIPQSGKQYISSTEEENEDTLDKPSKIFLETQSQYAKELESMRKNKEEEIRLKIINEEKDVDGENFDKTKTEHRVRKAILKLSRKDFYEKPTHDSDTDDEPLSNVDDAEIEQMLCTPSEEAAKTIIWERIHHDYLKNQEEKKKREERQIANGIQPKRKRKHVNNVNNEDNNDENTIQSKRMKRLSTKIDANIFAQLFGDDDDDDDDDMNLGIMNNNINNEEKVIETKVPIDIPAEERIRSVTIPSIISKKKAKKKKKTTIITDNEITDNNNDDNDNKEIEEASNVNNNNNNNNNIDDIDDIDDDEFGDYIDGHGPDENDIDALPSALHLLNPDHYNNDEEDGEDYYDEDY